MSMTETPGAVPSLRERIMGAAFSAFMEQGFARTSTLDIARRAHVSKRDLYALFGSKQAMFAACIAARTERMQTPPDLPEPHSRAALAATLTAFGARLLREVSRPEVLATFRLAIAEAEHAPELAATLDELGRVGTHRALGAMLTAAQARGLLEPAAAIEMAETFLAVLWRNGLFQRLLLRLEGAPDDAEAERRARHATDVLLRLHGTRRGKDGNPA